jgi:nitrate/TMAO reductase-like tetraheme cytochrome c subunit
MKKINILLIVSLIGFFQYCASSKKATTTSAPVSLTYISNVQPTIIANCSPCHIPPKGFKKALDTYDAAKTNISDMIRRINLNPNDKGFMPFKHNKLSDSVINIFVKWNADGLLEK